MKKFKSISTLFLTIVLVLSVFSTSVFAMTSYSGTETHANATIVSDGVGGKDITDSYYRIDTACTARNVSFTLPNFSNNLECQFMLSTSDAAMQIRMIMHGTAAKTSSGNHSYLYVEINENEMFFNYKNGSSAAWSTKWKESINLEAGKWYTLVAKFGDLSASSGEQQAEYYINGELIHSGSELSNLYGIRNWAFGPASADHPIYVDNVITTNGRGTSGGNDGLYTPDINRWTPSEVISSVSDIVVDSAAKTVTVLPETTVASVKNTIATTDGVDDIVEVYNSDLTTVANNSDYAYDKVIVVASKNGQTTEQAYNYYTIEEVEYDAEKGRGKNASDLHVASGTYNITSEGSIFGKAYHDEAYKVECITDGEGISIANTLLDKNTVGGSYGYFKCQFALEEGATLTIHMAYNPDASNYVRMNLTEGGTTLGSNEDAYIAAPIETGKWHTLCIIGPTSGDKNGKFAAYVDGKVIRTMNVSEAYYGMRRPFIVPTDATVYLDNIEVKAINTYDFADLSSWIDIDNAIIKGSEINYTAMPEASDFHPGADTSIRFYDANWNRLADTNGAAYVVAGDKDAAGYETRISYYTFAENASDYIAGGYYTKDNQFKAVAYGKNAGDSLYYATYESSKDELDNVIVDEIDSTTNKAELTGTLTDKPYRVFFWDKDLNPLAKSVSLELRK